MKFENTQVYNFEGALRGMRNPLSSWDKSDSYYDNRLYYRKYIIGENDMNLAKRLIAGGPEHRKFLRQIFVSVDITAPLYWWKEFDTYKIGTTANSTSTMHKLATTPITMSCFETDDYNHALPFGRTDSDYREPFGIYAEGIVDLMEKLRQLYISTKDKSYWKELIRWLPESWLQTRTVTMNYENLRTMYHQRKNHKLNEWSGCDDPTKPCFCGWVESLPYAKEFIIE